jgi:hypothetical protein
MHQLSKTDFIQYLNCPESLWLLKNKPNVYPRGEFSLFLEKLIKEGYEVEQYAKLLFPGGIDLPEHNTPSYTKQLLNSNHTVFFQPSFITQKGMFARIDILEKLFIKIIDNTKDRKFKISSEMMNLLGCSKENFYKLMNLMNYKKSKDSDTYYFSSDNKKNKDKVTINKNKVSPFSKLLALNIK